MNTGIQKWILNIHNPVVFMNIQKWNLDIHNSFLSIPYLILNINNSFTNIHNS